MERFRRTQLDVCILVVIRNLAWSRRQVGHACDRHEAEYIPCQDNPKVATAGKTRDTKCCWHCEVHRGQCEQAGLSKKRRREREKSGPPSEGHHVKRSAKKVVGFMDPSTEGDEKWERKRIKAERERPTTQSRKAIEHRPQGEWDDQRRWSFPCQRKEHQVASDAEVQATTISNLADFMSPSGSRRESSEMCAMRSHRERNHPGQQAQPI